MRGVEIEERGCFRLARYRGQIIGLQRDEWQDDLTWGSQGFWLVDGDAADGTSDMGRALSSLMPSKANRWRWAEIEREMGLPDA